MENIRIAMDKAIKDLRKNKNIVDAIEIMEAMYSSMTSTEQALEKYQEGTRLLKEIIEIQNRTIDCKDKYHLDVVTQKDKYFNEVVELKDRYIEELKEMIIQREKDFELLDFE